MTRVPSPHKHVNTVWHLRQSPARQAGVRAPRVLREPTGLSCPRSPSAEDRLCRERLGGRPLQAPDTLLRPRGSPGAHLCKQKGRRTLGSLSVQCTGRCRLHSLVPCLRSSSRRFHPVDGRLRVTQQSYGQTLGQSQAPLRLFQKNEGQFPNVSHSVRWSPGTLAAPGVGNLLLSPAAPGWGPQRRARPAPAPRPPHLACPCAAPRGPSGARLDPRIPAAPHEQRGEEKQRLCE